MEEIRAIPTNGYRVVSTFSGCGGSCLGYRWAGFDVVFASEFIPRAIETYRANHKSYVDERDIRELTVDEIRSVVGDGEIDLLDGSPPCSDFSVAGGRSDGWGKVKKYSSSKQRVDDLFFEYIRILEGLRPRCFVAENVAGLAQSRIVGRFREILDRMKGAGYRVEARLLDAQWLGVPQRRKRLIFVGVRDDLRTPEGEEILPAFPSPLPYRYRLREALPHIEGQSGSNGKIARDAPSYCVVALGATQTFRSHFSGAYVLSRESPDAPVVKRKFTIEELRVVCGFPSDFILTGDYAEQYERLGRAVPPPMMRRIAETVRDEILSRSRS